MGTYNTIGEGVPDVHHLWGYPMDIREGVPDVHQGGGYPMYTFFPKPGLESEYSPLSGPNPQCAHSRVLGTLQAGDLGNFGLGKGHFAKTCPQGAGWAQVRYRQIWPEKGPKGPFFGQICSPFSSHTAAEGLTWVKLVPTWVQVAQNGINMG